MDAVTNQLSARLARRSIASFDATLRQAPDDTPIRMALGRYELRREIGRGAMGIVYEGWDRIIARRLAIKTIRLPASSDTESLDAIDRFRREAQAGGQLTHPNIVSVFDYGEADDIAYIVMEYVDGQSLSKLLNDNDKIPLSDKLRTMSDLLAGLQFSHEHGVIHRDIKPSNVMVTSAGRVKIADFGIARIECSALTQAGTVLGTPAYMPPEQFTGEVADARSDVYSAGLLLYELLTGHRLFEGTPSAIMQKVLNSDLPAPSQFARIVSPAFDVVLRRALAREPGHRYTSAAVFAEAIALAARQTGAIGRTDAPGITMPLRSASAISIRAAVIPMQPSAVPPTGKRALGHKIGKAAAAGCLILAGGGGWWLSQQPASQLPGHAYGSAVITTAPPQPGASASAEVPPNPPPIMVTNQTPTLTPHELPDPLASNPPAPRPSVVAADQAAEPEPSPTMPLLLSRAQEQPPTESNTTAADTTDSAAAAANLPAQQPEAESSYEEATDAPKASPPSVGTSGRDTVASVPSLRMLHTISDAHYLSSGIEFARERAQSLPCSALKITDKPDGWRISGPAQAGPDLDRLLADLRSLNHVTNSIIPMGRFACAPIALMATLARQTGDAQTSSGFSIQVDQPRITSGERLGINVTTMLPSVYIDLYQGDGSVHHLHPVLSGSINKMRANWMAAPPTGWLLIVTIGSETPLDLGTRPDTENAATYLNILQRQLQSATAPLVGGLAMVPVQDPPLPTVHSGQCATNIRRPESGSGFLSSITRVFRSRQDPVAIMRTHC